MIGTRMKRMRALTAIFVASLSLFGIEARARAAAFLLPPVAGTPTVSNWADVVFAGTKTVVVTFNSANAPVPAVPVLAPVGVRQQGAISSAVTTWNAASPVLMNNFSFASMGFAAGTPIKALGASHFDTESILLHELGHALGLDHPNWGDRVREAPADATSLDVCPSQSMGMGAKRATASGPVPPGMCVYGAGVDGIPGTADDTRAPNVSWHIVPLAGFAMNNPFLPIFGNIDNLTYGLALPAPAFPQTPTREVASVLGVGALEAVMVQGARNLEIQRQLAQDDVVGFY